MISFLYENRTKSTRNENMLITIIMHAYHESEVYKKQNHVTI